MPERSFTIFQPLTGQSSSNGSVIKSGSCLTRWTTTLRLLTYNCLHIAPWTEPASCNLSKVCFYYSSIYSMLLTTDPELSSLLVNMRRDAQVALCIPLRSAIWNWIERYPEEFNDCLIYQRRLEGAPERVFDLLYGLHETAENRSHVWPALAALMCVSRDRMKREYDRFNSTTEPRHGRKVGLSCTLVVFPCLSVMRDSRIAISWIKSSRQCRGSRKYVKLLLSALWTFAGPLLGFDPPTLMLVYSA